MRVYLFAAVALLALPSMGSAQAPAAMPDDVKINQLIVYGDDPCPASSNEEIIVCARKPDSDRYRIPENLRDNPNAGFNQSWATRAEALEYVGNSGIGSCSPVGPGGSVGCFEQLVRQARAERQNSDEVNWTRLVEEARQERLNRIDAASEAIERQLKEDGE